jgi:hypothetical protein
MTLQVTPKPYLLAPAAIRLEPAVWIDLFWLDHPMAPGLGARGEPWHPRAGQPHFNAATRRLGAIAMIKKTCVKV